MDTLICILLLSWAVAYFGFLPVSLVILTPIIGFALLIALLFHSSKPKTQKQLVKEQEAKNRAEYEARYLK